MQRDETNPGGSRGKGRKKNRKLKINRRRKAEGPLSTPGEGGGGRQFSQQRGGGKAIFLGKNSTTREYVTLQVREVNKTRGGNTKFMKSGKNPGLGSGCLELKDEQGKGEKVRVDIRAEDAMGQVKKKRGGIKTPGGTWERLVL